MCGDSTVSRVAAPDNVLHDGVLFWWMAVASPAAEAVARWYTTLDEGERRRADRFHFAVDRETYIAAHALTRALLAHVEALPPPGWRFGVGPSGPAVQLVACAAGCNCELGVDVEADEGVKSVPNPAALFFGRPGGRGQSGDSTLRRHPAITLEFGIEIGQSSNLGQCSLDCPVKSRDDNVVSVNVVGNCSNPSATPVAAGAWLHRRAPCAARQHRRSGDRQSAIRSAFHLRHNRRKSTRPAVRTC